MYVSKLLLTVETAEILADVNWWLILLKNSDGTSIANNQC